MYSRHPSILELHQNHRKLVGQSGELARAVCGTRGLRVVVGDLGYLDAWSYEVRGNGYIVVNKYHGIERQTWSVGHELGHHYLGHDLPSGDDERRAHAWAASFFMPPWLMQSLVNCKLNSYQIARKIGLSHEAVDRRLRFLGLHTFKVPF